MEGWGSQTQGSGLHSVLFHGIWDLEEGLRHINGLELWAFWLMLSQPEADFSWPGGLDRV